MRRFVIVSALFFVARPEYAANVGAHVHDRVTDDHQSNVNDHERLDKAMRQMIESSRPYRASGSDSAVMLFGHLNWKKRSRQRNARHTTALSAVKSAFGLAFHKCAQVETGSGFPQLRVMLVITNPSEGGVLSQLCIHDSVSNIKLLETNGSIQERGYQTFTTDSLPAGSEYVLQYRVSVPANRNQVLILPAFLTFSNATQNDIHLFGPVVANFTLRINATQQVNVAVLFRSFMVSFLLMLLLLFVSVGSVILVLRRSTQRRRSLGEEAGPYDGICDITESANQEAAFEDKFVDIMMLEDPQNMTHALDSLNISTRLRSMAAVEQMRVQMYRGIFVVLLGNVRAAGHLSVQAERRVLGVVQGQIVGMEGKVQEEHVTRMAALAAQCNLETQEEMQSQQRMHAAEKAYAGRLSQETQLQEVHALIDKLHTEEQRCLQSCLLTRHEYVSAQAQRQQALRRRFELHKIFGEELWEATIAGELQENTANKLLQQYYSCQHSLEEVLDVLLANQRALLAERHARRSFLVQAVQNLQAVINDVLSSTATEGACGMFHQGSDTQLEVLRVKQDLEETVSQECRAIRSDIIKRRRQFLSERVCEYRHQLQGLSEASDITVSQYLEKCAKMLLHQNIELSELINHLDKQTAGIVNKVTLRLLQDSLAQLQAHTAAHFLPQTDAVQEKLQTLSKADACRLQSTLSCIQHVKEQELQEQRHVRDDFREYCSCVCASQLSLSSEHWLRLQLECVKAACSLDHCLVLPHSNPIATAAAVDASEMQRSEVKDLQQLQWSMQKRLQQLKHKETQTDALQREWNEACVFQAQQLSVCQERVAVFLAALQWEHSEKTVKIAETHTALLRLQRLIAEELKNTPDITHAIHRHCLALEEAELLLQKEELVLEARLKGWGSSDGGDDGEEDVFAVDSERSVVVHLQEALYKRQQLTRQLTYRVLRRNQAVEHQRDQIQLKRLYTYCQQDLDWTAVLISQAQVRLPNLHRVLRLLLPTIPEGELLSLIDALEPRAGVSSGSCDFLADRLSQDVLPHSPQHDDRERDRLLKKRQKLCVKLFSGARSSEEVCEVQQTDKQIPDFSQTPSLTQRPKLQISDGIGDESEDVWPEITSPHKKSDISTERLFIFRCSSPALNENTQTSCTSRKKRNFLNFKSRIAPQQQT